MAANPQHQNKFPRLGAIEESNRVAGTEHHRYKVPMPDFARARLNMVESQIRTNKVTDPAILAAFSEVPREAFVDPALRGVAYIDEDLPLKPGRFLVEPMVLARMIQALGVQPTDLVLDAGCATGYASAILARLASTVVALESDPQLAAAARRNLAALSVDNVVVEQGPLDRGCAKQGPFDGILIEGRVTQVPKVLFDQLALGGRLTAVVDAEDGVTGRAMLFQNTDGVIARRTLFDANTPPLPGFERHAQFVF
jgi:protein-L-isoaspartate(D-aspartate) O-methyltransferase